MSEKSRGKRQFLVGWTRTACLQRPVMRTQTPLGHSVTTVTTIKPSATARFWCILSQSEATMEIPAKLTALELIACLARAMATSNWTFRIKGFFL